MALLAVRISCGDKNASKAKIYTYFKDPISRRIKEGAHDDFISYNESQYQNDHSAKETAETIQFIA